MFNNAGRAVQPALTATANGDSTDKPINAHASLTKRSATSCHSRGSSKWAYGDSSKITKTLFYQFKYCYLNLKNSIKYY